jgi:mannose-6-phosphate isomerase-like protein (cupin superfamily)
MTERLKLTPNESVTIRESTDAILEVEAEYAFGGSPPPKHFHPSQDERFRVLAGRLQVRVEGEERPLSVGEELEIPRGAVHQMWNPGDAPARVAWRTSPGGRTEQWFRAIDAVYRSGRVASNGMPGPLAFAVLLTEYRDVIRLAVGPGPLVAGALRALAVLGRARGYRAAPA